jgi:hypothetical protein
MIHFINTQTMEYPVYEGQLKYEAAIDQALTYPDYPIPENFALVTIAELPTFDIATQIVDTASPELIDGLWVRGWTVRDLTQEEITAIQEQQAQIAALQAQFEEDKKKWETTTPGLNELVQIG